MKNRKIVIAIIICVTLVITFVMLTSYALWRVKETQSNSNVIIGACLRLVLEEETDENNNVIGGFTLEDAWPMSDTLGGKTKGYTFILENTCPRPVNYQVALESLEIDNKNENDYLDNDYVKIKFDNKEIKKYSEFLEIDNDLNSDYLEDIRETRQIYTGTILGRSDAIVQNRVTHNIKIWISEDAPNSEIGKAFRSKIRIYAGQGIPQPEYAITPESCFDFDSETGTITGYHEVECPTDYLVLPAAINDVVVKKIDYSEDNQSDREINWNYVDLSKATSLEEIGERVFYNYVGEGKELVLPESLITIETYAFKGFNGSNLVLGSNLDSIGMMAFQDYQGLNQELVIPNSVTTLDIGAFMNYNGVNLTLGNGLKTIKTSAFHEYHGIGQDLIIPDSVIDIGNSAFGSFVGDNLTIGNNVEIIEHHAFYNYLGTNKELIIPDKVKKIGGSAFENLNGTNLIIGSGIEEIEIFAFRNYFGTINVKMSETDFNNANIDESWRNSSSTLNFMY